MKSKIKKLKNFIALFVAIFFYGNVHAQQVVDLHFSNVYATGSTLNFTIKMKAGTNYGANTWRLVTSNIFIDVVDQNGDGVIYFTPSAGSTIALPANPVFNNLAWKVMSSSGKDYRLGLTLTKGGYNNPPQDINDEYMVVAQYSIPYISGNPVGAFLRITSLTESDGDYTRWGANEAPPSPGWAVDLPYNVSKPAGYPIETTPTQAIWTGAMDSDWFDADNWANPVDGTKSPGVPGSITDVYIPGKM